VAEPAALEKAAGDIADLIKFRMVADNILKVKWDGRMCSEPLYILTHVIHRKPTVYYLDLIIRDY